MSNCLYRIGLTGLGGLLVGCVYPSLQMGEGAGGSSTTSTAFGSGGTVASGGTSAAIVIGGAVTTTAKGGNGGSGGAITSTPGSGGNVGNGGAVTTTAKGGNGGSGGAVTTTPGSGGAVTTIPGSGGAVTSSGGTGIVNPSSGGVITTLGSGGTVTTATTAVTCTSATNLIALALASSTTGNWIGGDSAVSTDNPCGVQGAIYAYSDLGLDKTSCSADDSVQVPPRDPANTDPAARLSPCSGGKCCISGTTSLWPMSGSTTDYNASVWGGGIGITLNDAGSGATSSKQAYAGIATGFNLQLSGTLNGQVIRLGYTQSATDQATPFKQITSLGSTSLPFTGVTCPTWTSPCVAPGLHPYDLQILVVGGDFAGAFNICIDSMTPIL